MKRLEEADPAKGGGLFAGPLRLLALEVYEKLNKSGVLCNLATGQEKREVPGATHCSSTVEMVNITDEYDVAVIDEIQMIADEDRGHAWYATILIFADMTFLCIFRSALCICARRILFKFCHYLS